MFSWSSTYGNQVKKFTTTGWTTIFCTNPTTCTSPETAVTLTAPGGKLRMQTNKRYAQAYYTFTTVPGRVYKVKYRLSGVTFGLTNTSVFAPINRTELYTSANLQSSAINGVDREMIFTATEASVRFYITRGWAPGQTTPAEEAYLDYLNIAEVPSQVNTISCTSINENMVMLANSGVVMTNFTAVANMLNAYYNRTYTYAEYQAILNHCTDLPASYVLAKEGAEAASVKASYARGFNGMLRDDETYGEGNAYDFGARILDVRLGRWLSLDPLQGSYPDLSAYNAMANNPIHFIDHDGRIIIVADKKQQAIVLGYMKDQGLDGLYSFRKNGTLKLEKKIFNKVKGSLTPEQLDVATGINKVLKAPEVIEVLIFPNQNVNFKRNPLINVVEYNPITGKGETVKKEAFSAGSGLNVPVLTGPGITLEADPQDDRAFVLINQSAASTESFDADGGGKTTPNESAVFIHELLDHGLDYVNNHHLSDSKKSPQEKVKYHNKGLNNAVPNSPKRNGSDHD